jgi:PII-like signaling protein
MTSAVAVQVTIYRNDGDPWHGKPWVVEILNYLRRENAYAPTAIHAAGGFLGRHKVETAQVVDAGANCR